MGSRKCETEAAQRPAVQASEPPEVGQATTKAGLKTDAGYPKKLTAASSITLFDLAK